MKSKESNIRLNSNPSIEELVQMHTLWKDCGIQSLANMFYYEHEGHETNAYHFTLEGDDLEALFHNLIPDEPIILRLYMGAYYSDEPNPKLRFVPIIQGLQAVDFNLRIGDNCFLPQVVFSAPPSWIPEGEAAEIIDAWLKYFKEDIPGLVQIPSAKRVKFMTFNHNDSEGIRKLYYNHPNETRRLNIHLGYEEPTDSTRPFGFRIVLEFNAISSDGTLISENYEFSNPCPPLCEELIPIK